MQQGKVKDVCKETKSRYKMRHVQHTIFKDKVRIGMPGKDMTTREGHREKSLKVSIRIAKEFRELVMSRNSRYLKTGQNRKTVASLKKNSMYRVFRKSCVLFKNFHYFGCTEIG